MAIASCQEVTLRRLEVDVEVLIGFCVGCKSCRKGSVSSFSDTRLPIVRQLLIKAMVWFVCLCCQRTKIGRHEGLYQELLWLDFLLRSDLDKILGSFCGPKPPWKLNVFHVTASVMYLVLTFICAHQLQEDKVQELVCMHDKSLA